ncbi:MAG: acetyl ornithine aminotransferase family protein [Anaerolineae bacterium]
MSIEFVEMTDIPTTPELRTALPGPLGEAILRADDRVISPSYTRSYPFVMSHGRGCVVWDVDGNRFLDFTAGVATTATGHSHPRVVEAIQRQAAQFLHMAGTDFYYDLQSKLADKLCAITPGDFPKRVFFTNSGTESNEAALKLARYHTGRSRLMSFIGSFHGRTMGSLALTGSKAIHRRGFEPLMPGVTHTLYGYCYRCPINLTYPDCSIACVDYIEDTLFRRLVPADEVAAIFVEPIQGEGGYVVPPPGWHERLRAICDKHGILLVADEIQSGFGRTGTWSAIEHWGAVPDIVSYAKGIASGMPLGAIVARADVMTWDSGSHANTFGGNPVACAAALATIEVIENEGLLENAARMGDYMQAALREMQPRHAAMGDIRGLGLMIGVELIDPETGDPDAQLRDEVVQQCFARGMLILGCGLNTIRFMPALIIDKATADSGLAIYEAALTAAEDALSRRPPKSQGV